MYSILYFDTEDSISPPACGADDIVLWIADELTRRGIIGSFHVIGDKALTLEQRGRRDVLDAVRRHDASSHYHHGSRHPTTTERIVEVDWDQGVKIALATEAPGFALIERLFGRCAGLTRHGGSYTPQAVHAAGRCGKVFYGVPFALPGHRAFWFAGTLCFSILGLVIDPATNHNGPGYFEGVYPEDDAFTRHLETFDAHLAEAARTHAFTSMFGAHPHRLNTTEYSCWNYYDGVNRPQPLPPPLRPEAQRQAIRRNFLRYLDHLAATRHTHIVGLSQVADIFGQSSVTVSAAQLHDYAQRVRSSDDVPLHPHFSPAELLVALADAVVAWSTRGALPAVLSVVPVIGPTQASAEETGATVDFNALVAQATALGQNVRHTGRLPHEPEPARLLSLLALAYDDLASGRAARAWVPSARAPWPQVAQSWRAQVLALAGWRVFAPGMDFTSVADFTCLQAWSAKPAWPR